MFRTPPFTVARELTSLTRDTAEDTEARVVFRQVDAWLAEPAQVELLHRPSQRLQTAVYVHTRMLLTKGSDPRQRSSARAIAAVLTAVHSQDLAERMPAPAAPEPPRAPRPANQAGLGRRIRSALSGNARAE